MFLLTKILSGACLAALALRVTQITDGLRALVWSRAGRDPAASPVVLPLYGRLGRLARRFEALMARLVAGRKPRSARAPQTRSPSSADRGPVLPPRAFWLGGMIQEANTYGYRLQCLLAEPEMRALLAANPGAVRILRPLCRLLRIDLPAIVAQPVRRRRVAVAGALPASAGVGGACVGQVEAVMRKPPWVSG